MEKTNLQLPREKEGDKRNINWEIVTNIFTLLCIKQITNKNLLYGTGNLILYSGLYGKRILKKKKKSGYMIHFGVHLKLL